MKSLSLVVFWVALASCLFAQETNVVKKEKQVSVEVNKDNDVRTVKITTSEDGKEKVMQWEDNGVIPDDIRKQLEKENIDVSILEGGSGGEREVTVEVDATNSGKMMKKKMIIIKSDNDDTSEYEWDGEGEMPQEMKELLEEHDIQIDDLGGKHEGHKAKIRVRKAEHKARGRKARKRGRSQNARERQIRIIEDEGEGDIMEWTEEGADEGEDVRIIKLGGGNGRHKMMFIADEDVNVSDAYMGAQIESTDMGAKILDVMKDGPADKAGLESGDIVKKLNGARTKSMEDLLNILNYYEPSDKVELSVIRNGKEKSIKLELGKRPDAYR